MDEEEHESYGNFLTGVGVSQNPFLKSAEDQRMERNRFTGNAFGQQGADKNGRDMVYTGNGIGNCFSGNTGVETTIPAPDQFPACPFDGANTESQDAFAALADWAVAKNYRKSWVTKPHAGRSDGVQPIDGDWKNGVKYGPKTL